MIARSRNFLWSLLLAVVLLCIYYPSLLTGFFADDYNFLEPAARLNLSEYLTHYLDPRAQILWYRPLQGIQILLEYELFGVNPAPYHIVQTIIHWANCLLLFGLIQRISGKWRFAVLSTLLYATFPVYALAVNWINITDPLMTTFYLLAIRFWLEYLQGGRARYFVFTLIAFVFALLTKQMAVSLPIILFAFDCLLIRDRVTIPQLIQRYGMLVVVLGGYIILQNSISSTHAYASVFSYSFGSGVATILLQYFSLLTFPWGYFPPTDTQITEGLPFVDWSNVLWLMVALALYAWITIRTHSRALIFLVASILITLAPVLLFPFVELRYLYLPSMAVAILFALGIEMAFRIPNYSAWMHQFAALAFGLLVVGTGLSIANANAGIFEIARQRRVPFRDIALRHPTFPQDSYLYFIDPVSPVYELSGMFTLRYGTGVLVGGTRRPQPTYLHGHQNAFVYYFDDTGAPHELVVQSTDNVVMTPTFPVIFGGMIALERVELARPDAQPGGAFAAILYWRAIAPLDKNYTVFVHLLDKDGNMVTGYDSQPGKGEMPTTNWPLHQQVVDSVALTIPQDAPVGAGLRLEIGIYDLKTLQRLWIVNDKGNSIADRLIVGSLQIVK